MTNTSAARTGIVKLQSLTGLRFVAALLVFLAHVQWRFPSGTARSVASNLFVQGRVGVSFFFILSGFVLTWSHRPGDPAGAFYRRRFARIMPAYWFVLVLAVIGSITISGQSIGTAIVRALPSVIGVQSWIPIRSIYFGGNTPGWSLSDELFFYALFPLLILLVRYRPWRWILLTVALIAIVVVPLALHPSTDSGLGYWAIYVLPAQRLSEFAIGICLASWMREGWRFPIPLLPAALFAAVVYVLTGHFVPLAFSLVAVTLVPFVLLIGAAAQSDIDGSASIFRVHWLTVLGEWSYSFYLVHLIAAGFVIWLANTLVPGEMSHNLVFTIIVLAVCLAVSLAISAALYYLLEKPMEKRLRGARPRPEMVAAE
jgi:peptidoglycan/LPS O-acetylase OafA/YrhL